MTSPHPDQPRLSTEDLTTILSQPWLITRLTCGTIVTWSQATTSQDTTVSLDLCLLALIAANVFLFGPFLLSQLGLGELGLESRLDTVLEEAQETYDRIQEVLPGSSAVLWDRLDHDPGDSNKTFLETLLENTLASVNLRNSLNLLEGVKELFAEDKEDSSETSEESNEESLNIQRQPIEVFKFPVDKHDSFGEGFHGLETVVGEVIDLSGYTDVERVAFYRLPRKEEEGWRMEDLLLKVMRRVIRIE